MKYLLFIFALGVASLARGQAVPLNRATAGDSMALARAVTNLTAISPLMFGAVGDGAHDDTAALTATMAAATNEHSVIDLQGRTYFITNGVTTAIGAVTVQNGGFLVPSDFLGAVITRNQTGRFPNGGLFWNLHFARQGTNAPDPSTTCIQSGRYNAGYANDVTVWRCYFSNFWRFVTIVNTPQFDIQHNFGGIAWSNAVYIASPWSAPGTTGEGGDESIIAFNDFNAGDSLGSPAAQYITNHLNTIQVDGYCIHLTVMNNNLGYCRQIFKESPFGHGDYTFIGGENEGFRGAGGPGEKFPVFEFWNSTVHWFNCANPTTFGVTTNYSALLGLYATNKAHLNFGKCYFGNCDWSTWGSSSRPPYLADIWAADGPYRPIDGVSVPDIQAFNNNSLVLHTNWGDAGLVIGPNNGNLLSTYRPFAANLGVLWQALPGQAIDINHGVRFSALPGGQQVEFLNNGYGVQFDGAPNFLAGLHSQLYSDRGGEPVTLWAQHSGDWRLTSDTANAGNWDLRGSGHAVYVAARVSATNAANQFVGTYAGNGAGLTNLAALTMTNSAADVIASGGSFTAGMAGFLNLSILCTNDQVVWISNQTSHAVSLVGNLAGLRTNYESVLFPMNKGDVATVTNMLGTGGSRVAASWFQVLH